MKLNIRRARVEDVERVVRLANAGGPEGKPREQLPDILPTYYFDTFRKIDADPTNALMVAEYDGEVVGTFHLTYICYLAGKGREDILVEAVHVAEAMRNRGIGAQMMKWVIDQAKARNCRRIELTTNKARHDAHRFYQRLGFTASHEGMKLVL